MKIESFEEIKNFQHKFNGRNKVYINTQIKFKHIMNKCNELQ